MYVLRYDQDRAQMVGPFDDADEATRWAKATNVDDDPRWAIVCNCEVTVVEPLAVTRATEVILVREAIFVPHIAQTYYEMLEQRVPVEHVASLVENHAELLAKLTVSGEVDYRDYVQDLVTFHNTIIRVYN